MLLAYIHACQGNETCMQVINFVVVGMDSSYADDRASTLLFHCSIVQDIAWWAVLPASKRAIIDVLRPSVELSKGQVNANGWKGILP